MSDGIHLVQVSRDAAVFDQSSEPHQRQLRYGEELQRRCPGSTISFLVFGERNAPDSSPCTQKNVTFYRLGKLGIVSLVKLFNLLIKLNREKRINVITVQTIFDEMLIALLVGKVIGTNVVGQVHFDPFAEDAQRDQFPWCKFGPLRYWLGLKMLRFVHSLRVVGQRIGFELSARTASHERKSYSD